AAAALALQVRDLHVEEVRDDLLNLLDADELVARLNEVLEDVARELRGEDAPVEAREGGEAGERALELPNVRRDVRREEDGDVVDVLVAGRGDDLVHELLGVEVDDLRGGLLLEDAVTDRVQKVRLSETHAAVDEERVVVVAGHLGDRETGRVDELVRGADDEG